MNDLPTSDSIFTKIIKGEIPCHKVYEDDKTFAFLDINPIQPGHTLVVPKQQVDLLWDLDDETYQALMDTTKKIAKRLQAVLQPGRVCELVQGFEVPHAHMKLIPCTDENDILKQPDADASPDHEALAKIAAALAF